jgi:tripartite-type tricarboxylate transporter receptor subunit TctC
MSMRKLLAIIFTSAILNLGLLNSSYSQSRFFDGKTITIVQGRGPGGAGDLRVRALVPFLKKYIPGEPTIVSEYMSGGGGRKAANHIFKSAKPDGLTIGNIGGGLVTSAVLGATGVEYDLDRFILLGSTNTSQHYVFFTNKSAGLDSVEKLRAAAGVRIGAREVGDQFYTAGRLFAYLIGIREPKFVLGYTGAELYTAMEREEFDARAHVVDVLMQQRPEWIKKGLLDFHGIIEIPKGLKDSHFGRLPELESFAKSDKERRTLALFRGLRVFGTSYLLPPATPQEPVQILQEAFRKTFNDPAFAKEFNKLTGEDPHPLAADVIQKSLKELPREPEIILLYKEIAGVKPLPPR